MSDSHVPIQYRVACPYCKAKPGTACHVNRRNVCIEIHGVHKPRMRRALKKYPVHRDPTTREETGR